MLQAKNLTIGYSDAIAHAEEIIIHSGDFIALVGRNGSGKSTLIHSLSGKIPPLNGLISLDGKDLSSYTASQLACKIAWVNAGFLGVPHLTVLDYVLLGRTPYLGWLGNPTTEDRMAAQKALDFVSAGHLKDDQTTSLSDGERQLVSIARALAQETPYLFLDEPTAFLDFFHRKNVLALLKEIAQVKKIGIILSTHELDLVVNLNLPLILVSKGGTILHHPSIANRQALENLLS